MALGSIHGVCVVGIVQWVLPDPVKFDRGEGIFAGIPLVVIRTVVIRDGDRVIRQGIFADDRIGDTERLLDIREIFGSCGVTSTAIVSRKRCKSYYTEDTEDGNDYNELHKSEGPPCHHTIYV